jgi:hypothetical protein
VGPRAILDAVVKRKIPSPRQESNSRTPITLTVTQRYTDWANRALFMPLYKSIIFLFLLLVSSSLTLPFRNFLFLFLNVLVTVTN